MGDSEREAFLAQFVAFGTHSIFDITREDKGPELGRGAAGRVIRTVSDSGTVHLIDDRFSRPEV